MTFINGNNGPMPFRPLFERHGVWKTHEQRFFNLSLYLVTTLGWQHKCRTRSSDFNDPDTVWLCVFSSSSTVSYLFPCAESYKESLIWLLLSRAKTTNYFLMSIYYAICRPPIIKYIFPEGRIITGM